MRNPNPPRRSRAAPWLLPIGLLACAWLGSAEALPAGGYRQSCNGSQLDGDVLRSACKDRSGNFHPTELRDVSQCVGDIMNDNGVLRCSRGTPPPRGSYAATCEQAVVDGQTLRANCRNRSGQLVRAALPNFVQCVTDVFNDNGVLGCNRGVPIPVGSYTQSCEQIFVEGADLRAVCRTRRGNTVASRLHDFRHCGGELQNDDGRLACPEAAAVPQGDYQRSCSETVVVGSELRSNCRDEHGNMQRTTLAEFAKCSGGIANFDGELHCNKNGDAPPGTYRDSCDRIWHDGETLHARCRDLDGRSRPSTLGGISSCRGDIGNSNGRLTCATGSAAAPRGNYAQSCSNIRATNERLTAVCRTLGSGERESILDDPGECSTAIENIDGFLSCVKGTGFGGAPRGSYHGSCHDVVVRGDLMTASCRRSDGSYVTSRLFTRDCSPLVVANEDGILKCGATAAVEQPTPGRLSRTICVFEAMPSGWIVVDVGRDVRCGDGDGNNLLSIVRFDQLPAGSTLAVCSDVWRPKPSGWSATSVFEDRSKCAWSEANTRNVTMIRRDR